MNRYSNVREAVDDLAMCSDTIQELMRRGCFICVTFGMQDVLNGYGWTYGMVVKAVLQGRKCDRPGCLYDETKPREQRMKEEREATLAGKSHRHTYVETEREIGFWFGIEEQTTVREFLEETLKEVDETY